MYPCSPKAQHKPLDNVYDLAAEAEALVMLIRLQEVPSALGVGRREDVKGQSARGSQSPEVDAKARD